MTEQQLEKEAADREELAQVVEDALTDALTAGKAVHAHELPRLVGRLAPAVVEAVWAWLDPNEP